MINIFLNRSIQIRYIYYISNDKFKDLVLKYAENLESYKLKTLKSDPKDLFDQDLSQLFLLITNEKFKIKFVSRLRNILVNTIRSAFAFGVLAFTVVYILRAL